MCIVRLFEETEFSQAEPYLVGQTSHLRFNETAQTQMTHATDSRVLFTAEGELADDLQRI